jgi:DNA-binding IclR family transcriptional regulator
MSNESSKTVERALRVLRAFDRSSPELSASELARRLQLSRTAIIRILNTLEGAGFLERMAGTLKYRIGLAACEVGALHLVGNPLVAVADEVLQDLAERTGFTAYLGAIYGGEVVILSLREGKLPLRFVWSAGERLPVTTTSVGKAMLMHMDRPRVDQIIGHGRLVGLTKASIATRAELDEQLARYRAKGWVPADEESFPGVSAIGAAILDGEGRPIAGLSLSFLAGANDAAAKERIGALVRDAAGAISRRVATYRAYGHRHLNPGIQVSRALAPAHLSERPGPPTIKERKAR